MTHRGDSGERMLLEFRAREAWSQRNYSTAQQLAEEWAALSLATDEEESWWNASFLKAECLRKQALMVESRALAESLASHPLTLQSPALTARVASLRAFALQGTGELTSSIDAARFAVRTAAGDPALSAIAIEAQNALVAALAESGRLDEAWAECLALDALLVRDPDDTYAGQSYWAMGNVAFLLKRIDEGVGYHQQAAQTLSPTNDLDLWARFNHGSAQFRLAGGLVGPETLECIERAEMAMSIAGGTERDRMELQLTRAHWLVLSGQRDAAVDSLVRITEHQDLLALHTAAQAHFLLGQALMDHGSDSDAVEHLALSENLFTQSGAEDRADVARALILGIDKT